MSASEASRRPVVSQDEGMRLGRIEQAAQKPLSKYQLDFNKVDRGTLLRNLGCYGD